MRKVHLCGMLPLQVAQELRRRVREETQLTCRCGLNRAYRSMQMRYYRHVHMTICRTCVRCQAHNPAALLSGADLEGQSASQHVRP